MVGVAVLRIFTAQLLLDYLCKDVSGLEKKKEENTISYTNQYLDPEPMQPTDIGNMWRETGSSGGLVASPVIDRKNGTAKRKGRVQEESNLLKYLMRDYDREVRPVYDAHQTMVVKVGITLTQIFDMDEKNQVLTTNIWLDQEWKDELLTWNPDDFHAIKKFLVPCDKLWLPDIVLYNSADDYSEQYFRSLASVDYEGNVFWPPPTKFRSTCPVDVKYFPFDDQTCNLKLSSWMYDGTKLNVTNLTSNIDLENYVPNGEWELLEARLVRTEQYYPCCDEPYPSMTVTIRIRRKTLYYMYNIVFPCMMMSSLTVLVFCLPPDSGEKIALGVTVILAFSVFMLAIAEKMPETSESIPLIGIYLTFVMAMTTVSVIMTVMVLNFFYRGPALTPVPAWAKKYIMSKGKLSSPGFSYRNKKRSIRGEVGGGDRGGLRRHWASFRRRYNFDVIRKQLLKAKTQHPPTHREGNNGTAVPVNQHIPLQISGSGRTLDVESYPFIDQTQPPFPPFLDQNPSSIQADRNNKENCRFADHCPEPFVEPEDDLFRVLRVLLEKEDQQNKDDMIRREWRLLAEIIDRWLFWSFFCVTTISTAVFILVVPYSQRGKFF